MNRRNRTQTGKRILGTVLAVSGIVVWAISAALRLTPHDGRDVSISHFEGRSLGVITGGASVASGIMLLVTAV